MDRETCMEMRIHELQNMLDMVTSLPEAAEALSRCQFSLRDSSSDAGAAAAAATGGGASPATSETGAVAPAEGAEAPPACSTGEAEEEAEEEEAEQEEAPVNVSGISGQQAATDAASAAPSPAEAAA